jgi:peptide/nickel transport system permease protein
MIPNRIKTSLKKEFRNNFLTRIAIVILAIIILITIFAPFFALHDPTKQQIGTGNASDLTDLPPIGFSYTTERVSPSGTLNVPKNATWGHPLGTNAQGQDVLSRLVYGGRVSILVGIFGVSIALLIGVPYGLISGYYSTRIDDILMRGADVMLSLPSLVLAVALIGVFRDSSFHTFSLPDLFVAAANSPTIPNLIIPRSAHVAQMPETVTFPLTVTIVISMVNWVWFARVARGEALSIRSQEYVKAAKSAGASNWHILRRHVLPNSITPIIVLATIQIGAIILLESALSFLGFSGATLSWGHDIARGQSDMRTQWWNAMFPGLAIVLTVICINLIGDWFRDALDPSIQGEGGI